MQRWYYHGVWLLQAGQWVLVQSTGPQQMDPDGAYQAFLSEPYTMQIGPPYAWSALWEWTGTAWVQVDSAQNY